jgi:DNA helicase-2/ATP-dependent DNA helicase PcrA
MRFLEYARACARRYRTAYCTDPSATSPAGDIPEDPYLNSSHVWSRDAPVFSASELLQRALASISAARILIEADDGGTLQGAQAVLDKHLLVYDAALDAQERRFDKLLVIHHELGHVAQHHDLIDRVENTAAILEPGAWSNAGAAAARYSRKALLEAEANAFAAELLCPSDAVFDLWRGHPSWNADGIAGRLDLPAALVRVQLAEGLRRWVQGAAEPEPERRKRTRRPNRRQEDAVNSVTRPTLIDAGPGTGKTATLVEHIGYLLQEGADPRELVALTFSNEAADELRQRVEDRFKSDVARRMTIATFHGFGYQLLLNYGYLLGYEGEPRILDTPAQEELLSRILGSISCHHIITLRNPRETAEEARKHLSHLKNALHTPEDLERELKDWTPADEEQELQKQRSEELLELYRAYEAAKRPAGGPWAVDFGDLILLPYQILRDYPQAREEVQARFRWLIVDEYQDTGSGVAPFLQQLTGPENLPWVVGDARQSIHRFRGAAPENVRNFARHFGHAGDAVEISLQINYRSASGIVRTANQLASLMENPAHTGPQKEFWRADEENPADVEVPFTVVVANCDAAEQQHVVERVQHWIQEEHVEPREIAVLARTNSDVRRLGLLLRAAEIPVTAGGIVTAEGAGGDLWGALLVPDGARTGLPRLAFALGRSAGLDCETINNAARVLLGTDGGKPNTDAAATLVAEALAVQRAFEKVAFAADPWLLLSVFLFDASDYLRRYLQDRTPEAELALGEIVTGLGLAAGHRFPRRELPVRESRLLFNEYFRRTLVKPTESVAHERSHRNAVRVMTCHASKGLEFPYVIVTDQVTRFRRTAEGKRPKPRYPWLPPTFQPDPDAEREQEDSLLFVAVTRAERQAVVSYAETANDRPKSPRRSPVFLLGAWLERFAEGPAEHVRMEAPQVDAVNLAFVWGVTERSSVAVRHIADDGCVIRGYLEGVLGFRIPVTPAPLYPELIGRGRSALRRIIEEAIEAKGLVPVEEAEEIFAAAWPEGEHDGHPHESLYRTLGRDGVLAYAAEYRPQGEVLLENVLDAPEDDVSLGLVALAQTPAGQIIALGLRAESLKALSKDGETIGWGELKGAARLPFALPAGKRPDLQARVYSLRDRRTYTYAINPRFLADTVTKARVRHRMLRDAEGSQPIAEQTCERCHLRGVCPHWMGLLPPLA